MGKVLLAHASATLRDEVLRRPARHTRWTAVIASAMVGADLENAVGSEPEADAGV